MYSSRYRNGKRNMKLLLTFLVGGSIIGLSQIIKDLFKLKVGQVTVLFVFLGSTLEFFDIYDKIIDIGGAGALLPITNFGHALAHASYERALDEGLIGLISGVYDNTSSGIAFTLIMGIVFAYIFKPKK